MRTGCQALGLSMAPTTEAASTQDACRTAAVAAQEAHAAASAEESKAGQGYDLHLLILGSLGSLHCSNRPRRGPLWRQLALELCLRRSRIWPSTPFCASHSTVRGAVLQTQGRAEWPSPSVRISPKHRSKGLGLQSAIRLGRVFAYKQYYSLTWIMHLDTHHPEHTCTRGPLKSFEALHATELSSGLSF